MHHPLQWTRAIHLDIYNMFPDEDGQQGRQAHREREREIGAETWIRAPMVRAFYKYIDRQIWSLVFDRFLFTVNDSQPAFRRRFQLCPVQEQHQASPWRT